MKEKIRFLIVTFLAFIPVFAIQKPLFMAYNHALGENITAADYLAVIWHGLSLDMTMAGYCTIIPLAVMLIAVWGSGKGVYILMKGYFLVVALLIAAVFSTDMALYEYWGFRLDATLLFYLQSPQDALASVPWKEFLRQFAIFILSAISITALFWKGVTQLIKPKSKRTHYFTTQSYKYTNRKRFSFLSKALSFGTLLLLGGLLILPIRGGISVSTANVGQVYFSPSLFLNHAAINPCFSLIASILKEQDFASQYNYLPEAERAATFSALTQQPQDTTNLQLLNTNRPNILLILLESFSANAVGILGGEGNATPQLDRLAANGILFTQMYANSFRTDRGIVSTLNGYAAQPTTSIMKYPAKSQSLPSIAKSLAQNGYQADMLYGGDINFTNMQSYFYASGYKQITADRDFPLASRLSKWGANDDVTFPALIEGIKQAEEKQPWFKTFLTLSSHEPFDVPFHHLEDPYLNAVAYTDSCLGSFIDSLSLLPVWKQTLVILVSDHGYLYPSTTKQYAPERQHIPMLWLGGALREPRVVETLTSQNDLPATLLHQLSIDASAFTFSKNIFNPDRSPYVFYTFNNGFGWIDNSGISVYNAESDQPLINAPTTGSNARLHKGKAMLQSLYDDLGGR